MSRQREIDRWPEPKTRRGIKLVVASCSRTGTMGLYEALGMLGYRPYHMFETTQSMAHMRVLEEAIVAHNNRFSGIKPYGKKEFDKWLADYDVFIELGSYLGMDAIEAYLEDPEVKFILTERDPDKWVSSFNNFLAVSILKKFEVFPVSFIKYFDQWLSMFFEVGKTMYDTFSNSIPYNTEGNKEALRQNYIEYIKSVKRTIPPERLCVIKLEDGLGWEQICPYLEKPIPDKPYPKGTDHEAVITARWVPIINNAMMKTAAVVTPVLGVGAWFLVRQGPQVISMLKGMRP